jgi:hypothetical protein
MPLQDQGWSLEGLFGGDPPAKDTKWVNNGGVTVCRDSANLLEKLFPCASLTLTHATHASSADIRAATACIRSGCARVSGVASGGNCPCEWQQFCAAQASQHA